MNYPPPKSLDNELHRNFRCTFEALGTIRALKASRYKPTQRTAGQAEVRISKFRKSPYLATFCVYKFKTSLKISFISKGKEIVISKELKSKPR